MKKLKVNLNYVVRGETVKTQPQQITQNYILASVNCKYDKGLEGTYRRTFARIMRKLDDAIDNNLEEIEIEEAELDLIKNALRDAKLLAAMSYNAVLLEDAIDEAIKNN